MKPGETHATSQCQPVQQLELIFGKDSFQIAAWFLRLCQANRRAVSILALNGKQIRITLRKSVEARFEVVLAGQNAERRLRAGIV